MTTRKASAPETKPKSTTARKRIPLKTKNAPERHVETTPPPHQPLPEPEPSVEERVAHALQTLLTRPPSSRKQHPVRALLAEHTDLLKRALAQGWTPLHIARSLREAGVSASIGTLCRHIRDLADIKLAKRKQPSRNKNTQKRKPLLPKGGSG